MAPSKRLRKPKDGTGGALDWVPVMRGASVLIAFMTENAARTGRRYISNRRWASGGSGRAGADHGVRAVRARDCGRVDPFLLLKGGRRLGALIASQRPAMAYGGSIIMGIGAVRGPFSLVGRSVRGAGAGSLLGYFGYFSAPCWA